jgi:hypothetical protein
MTKNLEPLDKDLVPPKPTPNRSDLSGVYHHPSTHSSRKASLRQPAMTEARRLSFVDTILINLTIMVPYVLSFLSIAAIYSFGSAANVNSSFENRFLVILLAIPALVPWFYSLRLLYRTLWGQRLSLTILIVIYLAFLLPVIDISVSMRNNDVSDVIVLSATFLMSQLHIWLIALYMRTEDWSFIGKMAILLLVATLVTTAILQK